MAESERIAPARAPRFTCQQFLGVLASQKPGLPEKELLAIMSRLFPRHCQSLPTVSRNPLQKLYDRTRKKLRKRDDGGGDFLSACNEAEWTLILSRGEECLHDADCKLGCDHEKHTYLWGDDPYSRSLHCTYVSD